MRDFNAGPMLYYESENHFNVEQDLHFHRKTFSGVELQVIRLLPALADRFALVILPKIAL